MVATSTLAQGLNLPCEIVILAGTDRYDELGSSGKRDEIPAHELLNALGRAGRAGSSAAGISIVIPGDVITYKPNDIRSLVRNRVLPIVFSESDNCLKVDDPLSVLILDRLDADATSTDPEFQHALRRLRLSFASTENGEIGGTLSRSLSAYRAATAGEAAGFRDKLDRASSLISEAVSLGEITWRDRLAANTGLSVSFVAKIELLLLNNLQSPSETIIDILSLVKKVVLEPPGCIFEVMRADNLEKFVSVDIDKVDREEFGRAAIEMIEVGYTCWVRGMQLQYIEDKLHPISEKLWSSVPLKARNRSKNCDLSRKFILHIIPDLAFACSLLTQILTFLEDEILVAERLIRSLRYTSRALRGGYDSLEGVCLSQIFDGRLSRVEIHRLEHNVFEGRNHVKANFSYSLGDITSKMRSYIVDSGGVEEWIRRTTV